jgi:hypothetical protein
VRAETSNDEGPADRLAALNGAIAVLSALRDGATGSALHLRRSLQEGSELDGKLVRAVETALLVAIMSPKVRDEDDFLGNGRSFFETVSGIFRAPAPTRPRVRTAYRDFEAAFSGRRVLSARIPRACDPIRG